MSEHERLEGFGSEWWDSEDLTSTPEEELGVVLADLVREEREISYRRRVLQGRIDLVRAELVSRGGVSIPPEELARILLGEQAPPSDPGGEKRQS